MALGITEWFIILIAVSSVWGFQSKSWFDKGRFTAYEIVHKKAYWKLISHLFLHADIMHLVLNGAVLFMFGKEVERYLLKQSNYGGAIYLILLLGSGVFSSLYGLYKYRNQPNYHAVGVSGSVSAVIFAFIAVYPAEPLRFILLPMIDIPGFVIGIAYLSYSWYMARRKLDNIGHDAHFLGAVFGLFFMFIYLPRLFVEFWETIGSFVPG